MSYPGIDYPKPIDRHLAHDRVKDAMTDALHVIADEHGCTVREAAIRLEAALPGMVTGALFHAVAEEEKDDLCPAGVVVIPPRVDDERNVV